MSWTEKTAEDARLIILRELCLQVDGRLNDLMLRRALDAFGITRSGDWLETQLYRLLELDAVTLTDVGGMKVASVTPAGRDHVEQRSILGGVTRPHELGQ
jgi:hypothetical protein